MKDTKIIRKVDSLGRITIPEDIRYKLRLYYFNEVEFFTSGDKIIIKRKDCQKCYKCKNDIIRFEANFCDICGAELRRK